MRYLCYIVLSSALSSCSSVAVTRTPGDVQHVEADKTPEAAQKIKEPATQQAKSVVLGKWKLVSVSGGYTGKGAPTPPNEYYTFKADSFIADRNGVVERGKYEWRLVKDIHSGKQTWLMTGLEWTFKPEGRDTLYAEMNVYDGYNYKLVREPLPVSPKRR